MTPDFNNRQRFLEQVGPETAIELDGVVLVDVRPDSQFTPEFLHAKNAATGESVSIQLNDNNLPRIVRDGLQCFEDLETFDFEESNNTRSRHRTPATGNRFEEVMQATGDPLFGILLKFCTPEGMSSQLILRYSAIKRGEISELLPDEESYERLRHNLHVFYQTRNYCDLAPEQRSLALLEMEALAGIKELEQRQTLALHNRLFGREPDNQS